MIIEAFNNFLLNNSVAFGIGLCVLTFILMEVGVYFNAKTAKIRGNLVSLTIGLKILSFAQAIVLVMFGFIVIISGLVVIETVYEYWERLLKIFGIVGFAAIFIWINTYIVKKNAKVAKHEHKFKKGMKLVCKKKFDGRCAKGIGKTITSRKGFYYEFVKNGDHDYIVVKSKGEDSSWYNEVREFKEDYFKKK